MDIRKLTIDTSATPPAEPKIKKRAQMCDPESESNRHKNMMRKRKWRRENPEKNKLNDLRCRVKKSADKRFGTYDSGERRKWIKNEIKIRLLKSKVRSQVSELRKVAKNNAQCICRPYFSLLNQIRTDSIIQSRDSLKLPPIRNASLDQQIYNHSNSLPVLKVAIPQIQILGFLLELRKSIQSKCNCRKM
ncbi:hypothetical protein BB560_002111 [Smittium megazygosporum]|uniref:DUF3020 domain-containing protein n=1 Tax=Smittium megazygosporum TaxID=133381 RepID=A0A2T9ZFV2_9FUNG|nr:hypothetical protein BB560_002111 [Smittium megazygosporum]